MHVITVGHRGEHLGGNDQAAYLAVRVFLTKIASQQSCDANIGGVLAFRQRFMIMDPRICHRSNVVAVVVTSGRNFCIGQRLFFTGKRITFVSESSIGLCRA